MLPRCRAPHGAPGWTSSCQPRRRSHQEGPLPPRRPPRRCWEPGLPPAGSAGRASGRGPAAFRVEGEPAWAAAAPFASISRPGSSDGQDAVSISSLEQGKAGSLLHSQGYFKAGQPDNFIKLTQESSRIQTGSSVSQSDSPMVLNL